MKTPWRKTIMLMMFFGVIILTSCLEIKAAETDTDETGTVISTDIILQEGNKYLNIDYQLCYYSDTVSDAAAYVRSQIDDHQEMIKLSIGIHDKEDLASLWNTIEETAYNDSESIDGNYLRLSISAMSLRIVDTKAYVSNTNQRIIYYECEPGYYNSGIQEQNVDFEVGKIVDSLSLSEDNDYTKLKKIYLYICSNVQYDWDFEPASFCAYGALANKKATCQGFSMLFYKLCRKADLDVNIICGKGDNGDDWGDHTWNVVNLDGKSYYLDSTWDSCDTTYNYFLRGETTFKLEHIADASDQQKYRAMENDYLIPEKDRTIFIYPYQQQEEEDQPEDGEDPENPPITTIKVTGVKIKGLSHRIAAGKKIQLEASVTPSTATNKELTWTSSNKKVATVDSKGKVTVKKKTGGKSVTITAIAKDGSGVKGTWKIKSMKGVVKSIKVKGSKSIKAGKKLKLRAIVKATKGANKKLKWSSKNIKYATVNSKGLVKTKKTGKGKTVKITVEATDGSGKKKSIKIKLK